MSQEIKLWHIREGDKLEAWDASRMDFESRLESCIEQDVSILSSDLLVIGRQVQTDFGGVIDLLCLDRYGDTVIVELKRGLTPREVTAQALDYASWVHQLSNDDIRDQTERYLGSDAALDQAFAKRFEADLPEVLNENQGILIVGSEIDASTERIINYLSDVYGANINAVTFQYFREADGGELLARVFLVEPSRVDYQARTKGRSKRRRNLTYEELQRLADENGVGELYGRSVTDLSKLFRRHTTVSSIAFDGDYETSRRVFFSLIPGKSSRQDGLHFQIYALRICEMLGLSDAALLSLLPRTREPWIYHEGAGPEYSGYAGFFRDYAEIDCFVAGVKEKVT